MPTYQYVCVSCSKDLEAVQKFTDDPLTVCPHCEGRLRKVFSPVGVVFKGSGFYRNDSREASKSTGSAGSSNGKAKSSDDSSGSGSSESSSTSKSSENGSGGSSSSSSSSGSAKAADAAA